MSGTRIRKKKYETFLWIVPQCQNIFCMLNNKLWARASSEWHQAALNINYTKHVGVFIVIFSYIKMSACSSEHSAVIWRQAPRRSYFSPILTHVLTQYFIALFSWWSYILLNYEGVHEMRFWYLFLLLLSMDNWCLKIHYSSVNSQYTQQLHFSQ